MFQLLFYATVTLITPGGWNNYTKSGEFLFLGSGLRENNSNRNTREKEKHADRQQQEKVLVSNCGKLKIESRDDCLRACCCCVVSDDHVRWPS